MSGFKLKCDCGDVKYCDLIGWLGTWDCLETLCSLKVKPMHTHTDSASYV